MNLKLFAAIIFYLTFTTSCKVQKANITYENKDLRIQKVSKNTYIHTTYLKTKTFGNVPCNGMIATNRGEAIVFDTPTTDSVSAELIKWIQTKLDCKIKAVVVTHFHVDCLGGLREFHKRGIPSFSNQLTIDLAKTKDFAIPQNGFETDLELKIGNEKIICNYPGEGHTRDNIVGYFPKEKVLFGGCLVKSIGSGKGNLADANVKTWPKTIKNVKSKFSDLKFVIPGHGTFGGSELLNYTIDLFEKE